MTVKVVAAGARDDDTAIQAAAPAPDTSTVAAASASLLRMASSFPRDGDLLVVLIATPLVDPRLHQTRARLVVASFPKRLDPRATPKEHEWWGFQSDYERLTDGFHPAACLGRLSSPPSLCSRKASADPHDGQMTFGYPLRLRLVCPICF
jgi:hypothetical protein